MKPFVRAALVLALLAVPGTVRADTLSVNVQTDFRPGDEFIEAVATVRDFSTGDALGVGRVTAFLTDDYLSVGGAPIASFDVPEGLYRVFVSLRDASSMQIARRTVLVEFDEAKTVVAIVPRPTGEAEKSATLVVDNDGDGAVGVGDRVRYSVKLTAGETYVDDLSEDLALVPGSVITTHGRVSRGNDPADTTIRVTGLSGASEPIEVQYEADVTPKARNQGFLFVRGSFGGTAWVPTDDPGTAEEGDPTLLEISCPISSCRDEVNACELDRDLCQDELDQCEIALADCGLRNEQLEAEVTQLSGRLQELLSDSDEDGVAAVLDLCPGTPSGELVDDRGCSLEQFCSAIDIVEAGPATCNDADWLGDETGRNPRDCRARAGVCQPTS